MLRTGRMSSMSSGRLGSAAGARPGARRARGESMGSSFVVHPSTSTRGQRRASSSCRQPFASLLPDQVPAPGAAGRGAARSGRGGSRAAGSGRWPRRRGRRRSPRTTDSPGPQTSSMRSGGTPGRATSTRISAPVRRTRPPAAPSGGRRGRARARPAGRTAVAAARPARAGPPSRPRSRHRDCASCSSASPSCLFRACS